VGEVVIWGLTFRMFASLKEAILAGRARPGDHDASHPH
jgi:hypothetical protein